MTGEAAIALTDPGARSVSSIGRFCAIGAGVLTIALFVAGIPVSNAAHLSSAKDATIIPPVFASLAVGVLVAARRPRNAMGWCLIGVAFFLGCSTVGGGYSILAYTDHRALPLAGLAVVLQVGWAPAIMCLGVSFLLYPNGHFPSRVVAWVTRLVLALGCVWALGAVAIAVNAVVTHSVRLTKSADLVAIDNPHGAFAWWGSVQSAFFLSLGFSWLVWLVMQVPRYRHAGDEERHQLKWLLSGAVVALGFGFLASESLSGNGWAGWIGICGLTVLPVSILIGITKFHLYAIDRLVSRTLSYVLLTALVVGVYIGVVTLATKVIGFSSPVAVAASTLTAAAVFTPLRKRLQHTIDRRFNRARYDAERTVTAFATRLRGAVDPTSVSSDLIEVVHEAFEPTAVGLWIRRSGTFADEPVAEQA